MEQSLFIQYVAKFFPGLVNRVVEQLQAVDARRYFHQEMLTKEFSVTGKWESLSSTNALVAADVVAMDSSLPLKIRPSLAVATGDIAKMGMELKLNEQQLTALDTMIAIGSEEGQIAAKLFADTPRVINGIYERLEYMFLQGLSTGITSVLDTENVGTEVRLNYGYLTNHKFGAAGFVWSNASSTPIDDIERVLVQATNDGQTITKVMMDKTAFNNFAKNAQVKGIYGFTIGYTGATAGIPAASVKQMNVVMSERYGFEIEIVDRAVTIEINGNQSTKKPWADGAVVFHVGPTVGTLSWANLAELNHKNEQVVYEVADDYILVSKYCLTRPSLAEFTSSQARVVPVIGNVNAIYLLDTKTVQA